MFSFFRVSFELEAVGIGRLLVLAARPGRSVVIIDRQKLPNRVTVFANL